MPCHALVRKEEVVPGNSGQPVIEWSSHLHGKTPPMGLDRRRRRLAWCPLGCMLKGARPWRSEDDADCRE